MLTSLEKLFAYNSRVVRKEISAIRPAKESYTDKIVIHIFNAASSETFLQNYKFEQLEISHHYSINILESKKDLAFDLKDIVLRYFENNSSGKVIISFYKEWDYNILEECKDNIAESLYVSENVYSLIDKHSDSISRIKLNNVKYFRLKGFEKKISSNFIGRVKELKEIRSKYESFILSDDNVQLLGLKGDAGIGKTSLLKELEHKLLSDHPSHHIIFPQHFDSSPFSLITSLINTDTIKTGKTEVRKIKEKLELFLLKKENKIKAEDTKEFFLRTLLREYFTALFTIVNLKNIIVVVEDAHFRERTEMSILIKVITELLLDERKTSKKIFFVFSFRPEYKCPKNLSDIMQDVYELEGLKYEDLKKSFGMLRKNEKLEVLRKTGGNPLFLFEVINSYKKSSADELKLPDNIKIQIRSRLNMLNEKELLFLKLCSVIGVRIKTAYLELLYKELNLNNDIESMISYSVQKGFVQRNDESIYFSHEVYRSVIYQSASPGNKKLYHLLYARLLEKLHEDSKLYLYETAENYFHSEDEEKAPEYLLKAYTYADSISDQSSAYKFLKWYMMYEKQNGSLIEKGRELSIKVDSCMDYYNFLIKNYSKEEMDFPTNGVYNTEIGRISFYNNQYDLSKAYYKKALSIYKDKDLDKFTCTLCFYTQLLLKKGEVKKVPERIYHISKMISKKVLSHNTMCKALSVTTAYLKQIGNYNEAISISDKAIDLCSINNDRPNLVSFLDKKANCLHLQNKLGEAECLYLELIAILKEMKYKTPLSYAYFSLASLYIKLKKFKLVSKILAESKRMKRDVIELQRTATLYFTLADYYLELQNFSKADKNYKIALNIYQKISNKSSIANCYSNLGIVYNSIGKFELASEFYSRQYQIDLALNNKEGIARARLNITNNMKDSFPNSLENFVEQFDQIIDYCKAQKLKAYEAFSILSKSYLFYELERYEESFKCLKEYKKIPEKIMGNEIRNLVEFMTIMLKYYNSRMREDDLTLCEEEVIDLYKKTSDENLKGRQMEGLFFAFYNRQIIRKDILQRSMNHFANNYKITKLIDSFFRLNKLKTINLK